MEKLTVKPTAPCLHCKDRIVGCHEICQKYQVYRAQQDKYNKVVRAERKKRYGKDDFA